MSESKFVQIAVTVPEANADAVRQAAGEAGAGKVGNYTRCSFSVKGIGRFRPESGAHPAIGQVGKLEEVVEEKIEFVCEREQATKIITAIKKVHPYEEPAISIIPLDLV